MIKWTSKSVPKSSSNPHFWAALIGPVLTGSAATPRMIAWHCSMACVTQVGPFKDGWCPCPQIRWLAVGLEHEFCFSRYWECHHPNWLSYFSDGLKPPTRPCWLVMKWGLCYSLLSRMCIQVGIPMINQYFMGWNRSVFKAHVDRIKICLHQ